jgi:hypothetical protein
MFEVSFVIIKRFTDWYEYTAAVVLLAIDSCLLRVLKKERKKLLHSLHLFCKRPLKRKMAYLVSQS